MMRLSFNIHSHHTTTIIVFKNPTYIFNHILLPPSSLPLSASEQPGTSQRGPRVHLFGMAKVAGPKPQFLLRLCITVTVERSNHCIQLFNRSTF